MKIIIQHLLSIAACIILVVMTVLPCVAVENKTAFIVISGMNSFPLMNVFGEEIYPFSIKTVLQMASELVPPVGDYLINQNLDRFADSFLPIIKKYYEVIACSPDGNSRNIVTIREYTGNLSGCEAVFADEEKDELAVVRSGIELFGAENTYFFNYDWRLDPLEHADKLNALIESIRDNSDCSRIAIAAFSMGGTVVSSYLYKYGSDAIDSLSLCSTAFQGTSCVGELFSGDFELSADGLMNRLAQLTRDEFLENVVKYLNVKMSLSGINTRIEEFAAELTNELKDRIYTELLIPVFGYMPGFWALVNDDNFEASKNFMFGENPDAVLLDRINEYHFNVQNKAFELLSSAKKDTDIYIVAQYNMQGLPVSKTSTESNNDFLIDTVYASGGAICAPLGETLGDNYVQQKYSGICFVSPDGQIDASTCMFPEATWFIRDMGHVDYPYGEAADFVLYLADNCNLSVQNSDYPQFMRYSYKTDSLSAVTSNETESVYDRIFLFLTEILRSIYSFFGVK